MSDIEPTIRLVSTSYTIIRRYVLSGVPDVHPQYYERAARPFALTVTFLNGRFSSAKVSATFLKKDGTAGKQETAIIFYSTHAAPDWLRVFLELHP